jgi:nitroreductase
MLKKILRAFIPSFALNQLRKCRLFVNQIGLRLSFIMGMSGFGASLYYALASSEFWQEHRAVLKGKQLYFKRMRKGSGNAFQLRRNIHRLEKGLCMKPQRNIFATDYIEDTINHFIVFANGCADDFDDAQLKWAHDVLSQYFSIAGNHPVIDVARETFNKFSNTHANVGSFSGPYLRESSELSRISYEEFLKLSIQRRSVRWYLDKPVPRTLIDKAITAAALAPSACNRQPFEFMIYDDPELVHQVINIPGGTAGWSSSPPVVIALVGQLRAYFSERDRHLIYIDSSLSAMAFMLALETLGLSSCAINFPDIREYHLKISKLLSLGADEAVIMLISAGFADPAGLIPFSQKKNIELLRSYNKC